LKEKKERKERKEKKINIQKKFRIEVENWLKSIQRSEYIDAFIGNGFDRISIIKDMDKADLVSVGVKHSHLKKLLRGIASLNDCSLSELEGR